MANDLVPVQNIKQSVCIVEVGNEMGDKFIRTVDKRYVRRVLNRMSHEAEQKRLTSKGLLNEAYFSTTTLLEELENVKPPTKYDDVLSYSEIVQAIKTLIPERFWVEKFAAVAVRIYRAEPKQKRIPTDSPGWEMVQRERVGTRRMYIYTHRPPSDISHRFNIRTVKKMYVARMIEIEAAAAQWIDFELSRIDLVKFNKLTEGERKFKREYGKLKQLAQLITAMAHRKQTNAVSMDEYCDEWAKRLLGDVREGKLKADGKSHQTEVTAYEWMMDRRLRKEREKDESGS